MNSFGNLLNVYTFAIKVFALGGIKFGYKTVEVSVGCFKLTTLKATLKSTLPTYVTNKSVGESAFSIKMLPVLAANVNLANESTYMQTFTANDFIKWSTEDFTCGAY